MISTLLITGLKRTFPALNYRNFRYFWYGQCISLIGTWLQITAQQWLVYTMTKSALLLGFLGFAQFGPVMFLSLFAGVFVDRYPKKLILIFIQIVSMLQALILAFLVWSGHIVYWEVLILAFILGLANTLDIPARQSFVPDLVEKDALRSAIGLNMAALNSARIIGPAISAFLIVQFGTGLLFLLNGLSFIPVIYFLYLINSKSTVIKKVEKKVLAEILEGLNYIRHSSVMLSAVLSMIVLCGLVMNFNVIIPPYAAEVLKKGVREYGLLMSAPGIGALIGSLFAASKAMGNPKISILFGSGFMASSLLILLNFIHSLPLAVVTLTFIGFFILLLINATNLTLQLNSSDEFRGRVMSVYSFAFSGITPIGSIFAGSITEKFGSGMGFLISGVLSGFLIVLIAINYSFKRRAQQSAI